jgi:hypothetical protein
LSLPSLDRVRGCVALVDGSDDAGIDQRLAHPRLHSPILGLMEEYIVGLKDYASQLKKVNDGLAKSGNSDTPQFCHH